MMDSTNQQQHEQAPATSQASSHFPLDPVSGAVLFEQEARRRDLHNSCGRLLTTGCRELDTEVLCGGFERGCVVGISAEEGQGEGGVGLVLALQTLARRYVSAAALASGTEENVPRAMIITTLSMGALLPLLRDVFWGQLVAVGVGMMEDKKAGLLKGFLERIEIARVFDIPGLWEVLGDLDRLVDENDGILPADPPITDRRDEDVELQRPTVDDDAKGQDARSQQLPSSSPLSDPPSSLPDEPPWETTDEAEEMSRKTPPGHRDEIQDSEDEGGEGSSPLSQLGYASDLSAGQPPEDIPSSRTALLLNDNDHPEELSRQAATPIESPTFTTTAGSTENHPQGEASSKRPEIIIITHMSNLLSTLFQQREKSTAHHTLQLLSSHIRYLTRTPEYGGPLIMLLNSTTSSDNSSSTGAAPDRQDRPPPAAEAPSTSATPKNKTLDPSLRSIFNPPSLSVSGLNYTYDTPHARRNKPSFGLIFTQMLDMHFLCTRIPKTRDDAEAPYAPAETGVPSMKKSVAHGWVVEVLLDEIGIWEGRTAVERGRKRRSREQRWGAVEIRRDQKGIALADLFGRRDLSEEVAVATGFGGRRV